MKYNGLVDLFSSFPAKIILSLKETIGKFWYLSYCQAMKAQASLSNSPYSHNTKYGCRQRFSPKFRHLALLDMSVWKFKGGFCSNIYLSLDNGSLHLEHYAREC